MFYLLSIVLFIVDLYIAACWLRVLMQYHRAPFHNKLSLFVIRITRPGVLFFQRFIPGWKGIDLAIVVYLLLIVLLQQFAVLCFFINGYLSGLVLLLMVVFHALAILCHLYFYMVLFYGVSSWLRQDVLIDARQMVELIVNPFLRPIRRYVHPYKNIDWSPLVALLILWLIDRMCFNVLYAWLLHVFGFSSLILFVG